MGLHVGAEREKRGQVGGSFSYLVALAAAERTGRRPLNAAAFAAAADMICDSSMAYKAKENKQFNDRQTVFTHIRVKT